MLRMRLHRADQMEYILVHHFMALRFLMGCAAVGDDIQAEKGSVGSGETQAFVCFWPFILRLRSPVRNNVCASISGNKYLAVLIFNQKTVLPTLILLREKEAVVSVQCSRASYFIEIFFFHSPVLLTLTWWLSYWFWFEDYHKSVSLHFSCKWIQGKGRDG